MLAGTTNNLWFSLGSQANTSWKRYPWLRQVPKRSAASTGCTWRTSPSAGGIQVGNVDAGAVHQVLLGPALPGLSSSTEQLVRRGPACAQPIHRIVNTSDLLHVQKPTVQQRFTSSPDTLCMVCAVNVHV